GFEERRRLARSLGAAEVYDTSAGGDVARMIKESMVKKRMVKEDLVKEDLVKEGMDGVDVAIECSGSLTTLAMVIRAARQCGRIVGVGFYGAGTINLGEEFFHNRLTLLASLPAFAWNNPVRGPKPLYAKDLQELVARDFAMGKITSRGILNPTLAF